MKKLAFALSALAALVLLAPTTGSAYEDIMTIVFSEPAEGVELDVVAEPAMYEQKMAYIYLVNPSMPAIGGYEFSWVVGGTGSATQMTVTLAGTGPIDVGAIGNSHIVGLAAPMTTSYATLLTSINFLYMGGGDGDVTLTLTGATPNSVVNGVDMPAVLVGDADIVQVGTSSVAWVAGAVDGYPDDMHPEPGLTACFHCAPGPVATDETSWDGLKALYR